MVYHVELPLHVFNIEYAKDETPQHAHTQGIEGFQLSPSTLIYRIKMCDLCVCVCACVCIVYLLVHVLRVSWEGVSAQGGGCEYGMCTVPNLCTIIIDTCSFCTQACWLLATHLSL